jgi:hypothetical protein
MTNTGSTSTSNPTTPVPADADQISPNILQVTFKQGRTPISGRGRVAEKLSQQDIDALLETLHDEDSEVDATGSKSRRESWTRKVKAWAETAGTTAGYNVMPHFVQEKTNTVDAGVVHCYLTEVK